jgi:hypothetical protein
MAGRWKILKRVSLNIGTRGTMFRETATWQYLQLGFGFIRCARIRNVHVLFDGNQYIIKFGLTCHLIYFDFVVISSQFIPNPIPTCN